jgi:hypothetical protein
LQRQVSVVVMDQTFGDLEASFAAGGLGMGSRDESARRDRRGDQRERSGQVPHSGQRGVAARGRVAGVVPSLDFVRTFVDPDTVTEDRHGDR